MRTVRALSIGRRDAIRAALAAAGAAGGRWILGPAAKTMATLASVATMTSGPRAAGAQASRPGEPPVPGLLDGVVGLSPWLTPTGEFYTVSKNLFDPRVNENRWSLRVDGQVKRPLHLSYRELVAMAGQVEQYTTLSCISNPIGGDLIGNARWKGIPLARILELAAPREGVVDLRFEAADGYTDSIPLAKALEPTTLLALEMNGEPLPPEHGFPARLIVPGIYGMKNVKWITRIEAVPYDYKGYWEVRGWSDTAITRTLSRIDVPKDRGRLRQGRIEVAGIAFAGDRGIRAVEVSFDGGRSWEAAEVEPSPNAMTWSRWLKVWEPEGAGWYTLAVRAYDGSGQVQEQADVPPLPEGATGYHRIRVNVA